MKKITLLTISIIIGFSNFAFAQSSASASVFVTIVTPLQITTNSNLDFGIIATTGGSGSVVLHADNKGARNTSSNIIMSNSAGTVTAAVFTLTGQGNTAYSITMPASDLLINNGAQSMVVNNFTCSASKTLSNGKEIIYLGATLHLNDSQSLGTYSRLGMGIKVTVNYN